MWWKRIVLLPVLFGLVACGLPPAGGGAPGASTDIVVAEDEPSVVVSSKGGGFVPISVDPVIDSEAPAPRITFRGVSN